MYMFVELCAGNYATSNGLVNGVDDIFQTSTTYCEKIIIRIMFQSFKIKKLIRKNIVIITTTLIQNGH